MRLLFILLFMICDHAFATQITYPTIWSVNDTVTNVKLNNNNNAVSSVVNGNIDNTNTASGYFLYQLVAALPSAGTQGKVDFLTSDNSLNLDNGSAWLKTVTPTGTLATGQIPLYNSSWGLLTPGAQYLPLVSNGISSLPSYQNLSAHAGGTGVDSSAWTSGDVVYMSSTGTWGHETLAHGSQVFTGSGTFTAPTGVSWVYVSLIGGGAGGQVNGSGGGASAAWAIGIPYAVTAGNNYTVTIGAAGAVNAGAGGNTSFDNITCNGGSGQTGATQLNGVTSTPGQYCQAGGNGATGSPYAGGGSPLGKGGTTGSVACVGYGSGGQGTGNPTGSFAGCPGIVSLQW